MWNVRRDAQVEVSKRGAWIFIRRRCQSNKSKCPRCWETHHFLAILNDEGDGIISTIDLGGSNSKSECRFFALVSSRVTIDKVVVEEAQKMLPKGASLELARILSSSKDKAEEEERKR